MILLFFTLFAALLLSAISGYYSVIGLTLIFTGSFWPIVSMGASLEIAKLVTVSWMYRNWRTAPKVMLVYFGIAVFVLMMITSMGIFGYLSKSHIDSGVNKGDTTVQLQVLDEQEKFQRDRIEYLLKRGTAFENKSRNVDKQVQEAQAGLAEITKKKLPLLQEQNRQLADIGPIRYVAELLYDTNDAKFIDKAVRVVIFAIVPVFDPLAVLLWIAANMTISAKRKKPIDNAPADSVSLDEDHEVVSKRNIERFTP